MPRLRTAVPALLAAVACLVLTSPAPAQPRRPAAAPQGVLPAKSLARFEDFPDWVTSLAFSPDGKTLAAGSYEVVKLIDPAGKKVTGEIKVRGSARAMAFSPDGKWLAVGGYRSVTVWDAASLERRHDLADHTAYVTGIAFSPDGRRFATSSEDETLRIRDFETAEAVHVIEGHSYPVMGVAWSPDGKWLATVAGDETRVTRPGEVRVWNAATGEERFKLPDHEKAATSAAFSPDGRFLATTGEDEKVNVYDAVEGKPIGFFAGHSRATNAVVFAPGGETLISAAGGRAQGGNDVRIWNRADGEEWAVIEGHEGRVNAVALSPDGRTLATAGHDKRVALWDVASILDKARTQVAAREETPAAADDGPKELRAGIIGLDTSHVIAFTSLLNADDPPEEFAGCRIVAAYPRGSADIESSVSRVPGYTDQVRKMGVEIVDSIEALLERVDVVFLETNDGRPHLEQAVPVIRAGKPLFIDKPVAGSLADAVAIYELARKHGVPVFSSSSLRYRTGAQALRDGKIGDVLGCDAYSPCSLEPTHPDLFWYGIHGVETLFTVMGTGCRTVARTHTPDFDVVVGAWEDGRIGTFRGIRKGRSGHGGTAFGSKGIEQIGSYDAERGPYHGLMVEIVRFFRTGEPPVDESETLEIYAFMEAADESKRQEGRPVSLAEVMDKARRQAEQTLAGLE